MPTRLMFYRKVRWLYSRTQKQLLGQAGRERTPVQSQEKLIRDKRLFYNTVSSAFFNLLDN